jgi:hypothetical protein
MSRRSAKPNFNIRLKHWFDMPAAVDSIDIAAGEITPETESRVESHHTEHN